MKQQKGITLIALVITIIVLLILAIVSISLVWKDGIIQHANNAVTRYKDAQYNEQQQIDNANLVMGNYYPKSGS